MRDRPPRYRWLSYEPLEARIVLSSASGLLPDLAVNEDAADSFIDLDAVFTNPAVGLTGPLTYSTTVSTPVDNLVGQVSESHYMALLQDLLYTHVGDNRGLWGPQHNLARDNIAAYFTELGLETSLEQFNYNWTSPPTPAHNVVGIHRGTVRPNDVYVVGAHYDSGDNPGADDNGSGTAAVMEIARVLSQYSFDATLVFVAFDCEELLLLGSQAYVNAHAAENILGMVNLDMIAYNAPGDGHDSVFFYDCVTGGVIKSQLAAAFAAYGNGLATADGGYSTASDHYWFEKKGFDAALVIEHGWASNPNYHRPGDAVESDNYIDYAYAANIARGTLGYLATAAGLQTHHELLTATLESGDLILDYAPDANGIANITVQAQDAHGHHVADTFRVTVNSVNDLPTLDPLDDRVISNDDPTLTIPLTGIASGDGIGQPVRVSATSSAPGTLLDPSVSFDRLAGTGTLELTPVAHAAGSVIITVKVEDGGIDGRWDTASDNAVITRAFTVDVLPPQHPPTANADNYTTLESTVLNIAAPGVLANDLDVDGDSLCAVLVTAPAHGTVELRPDGSFTYTPHSLFNREDAFTYLASDGTQASQPVAVQIVVQTVYPWTNGIQPLNVNDDGYMHNGEFVHFITPIDALLVINELNRAGSRRLPLDRSRPLTSPFFDVNRDGFVTPVDALSVINYLNRKPPAGEGESSGADLHSWAVTLPMDAETAPTRVFETTSLVATMTSEPPAARVSWCTGSPPARDVGFHSWEDDETWWVKEDLEDLLSAT